MTKKLFWAGIFLMLAASAFASGASPESSGMDADLVTKMGVLVFQLGIILFAARMGGSLFEKWRIPSVLGELIAGVIIGPYFLGKLPLPGFSGGLFPVYQGFPISPELYGFATVASVVLLFLVGLETDLETLLSFSTAGLAVGIGGVIVSFFFGALTVVLFSGIVLGEAYSFSHPVSLFLGVISTATSVGITARILSEKKKMDSPEGVTIISGAVIDDVLGIIILAVIIGVVKGGHVEWKQIGFVAIKAIAIWLGFTAAGLMLARYLSGAVKLARDKTTMGIMSFAVALLLAGFFEKSGLAMIIGAYVAGLSFSKTDLSFVIQESLNVLSRFFVPVFFCVMGMLVNFSELASGKIILFGVIYFAFAVVGKILGCSLPALLLGFNTTGAMRVGFGMIPRGEVALIVAGIGLTAGIIPHDLFGVTILMTFATTLLTPPILSRMLETDRPVMRKEKQIKPDLRQVVYNMPNPETADLIVNKVCRAFESEGFYVHRMSIHERLYQMRKESIFITLRFSPDSLVFDCHESDEAFIHTVFFEVLAELERTMKNLQSFANKEKIGRMIFEKKPSGEPVPRTRISQILHPLSVEIDLSGNTKEEIINELIDLLMRSGQIDQLQRDRALRDLLERESVMSTGMQNGIALPHAKTDSVDRLMCAVGLKKSGADFDSLDMKPSKVFILTLSPKDSPESQLQFMAEMSKFLSSKEGREAIFSARTSYELYQAFTKA